MGYLDMAKRIFNNLNCTWFIDILLRLNWRRRNPERWEFRVCNHGCCHCTGIRLTQPSWSVQVQVQVQWLTGGAKLPLPLSYRLVSVTDSVLLCLVCQQRVSDTSADSEVEVSLCFQLNSLTRTQTQTQAFSLCDSSVSVSDAVSLLAERPPPKVGRNRSVPTWPCYNTCYLVS
jgi:hypothetical protein